LSSLINERKEKMGKDRFCPLVLAGVKAFSGGELGGMCREEMCNWWIKEQKGCAVTITAKKLSQLPDKILSDQ
jgi:hypothetical protein